MMGLPTIPPKKSKQLPPDDPINKALKQLEEYEEGTPKRTTASLGKCCPEEH